MTSSDPGDSSYDTQTGFDITMGKPKNRRKLKNYFPTIKRSYTPSNLTLNSEMTDLGLPEFLQHSYLTGRPPPEITELREWQRNLIQKPEWKEGKSCIVLVPTSGGKTVAADVAIAQLLKNDPKAKAIVALPFVALANEKFNEFTRRFFNFTVRPYYQNVGGSDFRVGSIAVCTYEKAHSILNQALMGKYNDLIKLVVIDEIHMIGEDYRGATIEALVTKCLLMKNPPRIIGLSATLSKNDAEGMAQWINGFSFISDTRPSQVKQLIKKGNGDLFSINGNQIGKKSIFTLTHVPEDPHNYLDPIRRLLSQTPDSTILIFVNTRKETLNVGSLIANKIYDPKVKLPQLRPVSPELEKRRKTLINEITRVSGGIEDNLKMCLLSGIGIHHAGLLLEERKLIESAARERTISVLVATTTLSAGINIHSVARVIISNIYRYGDNKKLLLIPAAQYTQMVGRAGRTAKKAGEAIVICNNDTQKEIDDIIQLSKHEINDLVPHLVEKGNLERFFLQCLSTYLIKSTDGISLFLSKSYKYDPNNKTIAEEAVKSLVDLKLIDDKLFKPTPLGRAIAGSSLTIEEGLALYDTIESIEMNLCLKDEIHLLYLCVSDQNVSTSSIKQVAYDHRNWVKIFAEHKHVIQLITKLDDYKYERIQLLPNIYGALGRVNPELDKKMERIYIAVILLDLINEVPIAEITKRFKADRGTIQSLQMQSATFAGQISKFCEIYGADLLAATLNRFRTRLNFAAKAELLNLMILPSCTKEISRHLVSCGISSPIELAELNIDAIAELIMPPDPDNERQEPTEEFKNIAAQILRDATQYTDGITKIDSLEEQAIIQGLS